jgi:hypothetical protein
MPEPSVIVTCILKVIGRAIVKVMQTGFFHRVVGRPDPHEGRNVREFAHGGIGNVGKPVAIGVVVHLGMGHAAAPSDFDVCSECRIFYLAVRMNKGGVGF